MKELNCYSWIFMQNEFQLVVQVMLYGIGLSKDDLVKV